MPNVADLARDHFEGKENVFASNRATTFLNSKYWVFDAKSTLSPEKMAEAGWICTSTDLDSPSGLCPFCGKELVFDDGDDPWEEHIRKGIDCPFIKIGKKDENTWTVGDYLLLLAALNAQQDLARLRKDMNTLLKAAQHLTKAVTTITK